MTQVSIRAGHPDESAEQVAARIARQIASRYKDCSPAEYLSGIYRDSNGNKCQGASLSERAAWLGSLTEKEQMALEYEWGFWARPKQRTPKGVWKILILLSGRGGGKTRQASETVREWIESGEKKHIALIAETARDLRDTVVENVYRQGSGLKQICPPWDTPHYSPTKMTLTWENPNRKSYGAVCSLYSAEKPAQLRGPSHDGAWLDEFCLVAGTMIQTEIGKIPIERICVGTNVWTRCGLRRVTATSVTGNQTVYEVKLSDGGIICGTGSHPVWVIGQGFTKIRSLVFGDILCRWDKKYALSSLVPFGEDAGGGLMAATTATVGENCCTEPFSAPSTDLSQTAWRYITKTRIKPTTLSKIFKCLRQLHTGSCTHYNALKGMWLGHANKELYPSARNGLLESRMKLFVQTAAKFVLREASAQSIAQAPVDHVNTARKCAIQKRCSVVTAARYFLDKYMIVPFTVRGPANRQLVMSGGYMPVVVGQDRVRSVARTSGLTTRELLHVPENVGSRTEVQSDAAPYVVSVRQATLRQRVYNFEVADCPEYFANDILTHNCKFQYGQEVWDMLRFTMRRGNNPQTLISTTPKPVPFLIDLLERAQEHHAQGLNDIIVIKGNTWENQSNLSADFLREMSDYEGTNLGRQELYADLVLNMEGALWNYAMIDNHRFQMKDGELNLPSFQMITVSVDPQTGYIEDTAVRKSRGLTGIIVAAKTMPVRGAPQHAYILADCSKNGKPETWAKAAVDAYNFYGDLYSVPTVMVVESNQGGKMVESIIRSVDPTVRLHVMHAHTKKHERAVPVVAKYQRGLVHHCGYLSELESEQISYTPGDEDRKRSPNRMDALVWAVRYLLVDGARAGVGMAISRRI